jgi:hypothetical protein
VKVARVALIVAGLLVALSVIAFPFTRVTYPPIVDLPFHATGISILRHDLDPTWHFREQFTVEFLKVPYWTLYVLGAFFALFVPVLTATKLATITCLALLPAGLAVLFHGMKKSPWLGVLGLGLVWNAFTYWGFINFLGALGLFAAAIGLTMLVVDAPTRARQGWLAVVLVLIFATHIFRFPFAVAGVIGTALMLYPSTRRFRVVLLPLVPSLLLFASWLAVRDHAVSELGLSDLTFVKERLQVFTRYLFTGFTDPDEAVAGRVAAEVLAVIAAVGLTFFIIERRWRQWTRQDLLFHLGATLSVLACATVFLGFYCSLPLSSGVWWLIYPREIVSALFLALALMPDLPARPGLRVALLAAVGLATINQSNVVATNFAKFEQDNADFVTIVKSLPKAPRLGYLVFDHTGTNRTASPFLHMPAWVQAEQGGWLSFHLFSWNASPIRYRAYDPNSRDVPPPTPNRFEWLPDQFDLQTRGAFFDWFLVRSAESPDSKFELTPTIHQVEHVGRWWLYKRDAS